VIPTHTARRIVASLGCYVLTSARWLLQAAADTGQRVRILIHVEADAPVDDGPSVLFADYDAIQEEVNKRRRDRGGLN